MKELFYTLRLTLCICVLPAALAYAVTASAQEQDSKPNTQTVTDETVVVEEIQPESGGLSAVTEDHSHVMMIDQSGGVSGRITLRGSLVEGTVPAPGLNVSINRRGQVIAETQTDWDGVFRFDNAPVGSFTFIASSMNAIATFGIYFANDENDKPEANAVQIDIVAVGESSQSSVRNIINSEVDPITYDLEVSPLVHELPVTAGPNMASLESNGTLSGKVVPLDWLSDKDPKFDMTGTEVYIFKDNVMIARAPLAPNGDFSIANFEPGIYDFASFGPHGAASFSVNLVSHDHVTMNALSPMALLTGMVTVPAVAQGVETVLSEPTAGPSVDVDVVVNAPPAGGFFGGGGGGGFGGGLGGLGGLLGLGLAGLAISEAGGNNATVTNPVILDPPPQSPGGN